MERLIVFLSSFLLFWIELLVADTFLAKFGGSYQVWLVSLSFFCFSLFIAYLSVKFFAYYGKVKAAILSSLVFFLVVIGNFLLLPSPQAYQPESLSSWGILCGLGATIGLPFLFLGMMTPLFQYLCSRHNELTHKVDKLFSASNWGALCGLLIPVFCLNVLMGLQAQFLLWKVLVALLGLGVCLYLFRFWKFRVEAESLFLKIDFRWIFYSFLTCALMLSVTNFISFGIGSAPLTWIIPLLIFLGTFAFIFEGKKVSQKFIHYLIFVWLIVFSLSFFNINLLLVISNTLGYYLFLLIACIIVNKEIYRLKPENPLQITSYNISLNVGGLFGTFFVAFIAPHMGRSFSNAYSELFYSIVFLAIFFLIRDGKKFQEKLEHYSFGAKLLLSVVVFCILYAIFYSFCSFYKNDLLYVRNFYGINRVSLRFGTKMLINGRTAHGAQYLDKVKKEFPLMYYHPKSPVGEFFAKNIKRNKVAAIGLGAGSIAYYSRPGDEWTFFELDPDVSIIAAQYFDFLKSSKGKVAVVIGDGRLKMNESKDIFDVIVLDAFTSDHIPRHLLTREAFDIYLKHLSPEGSLLLNISNSFLKFHAILIPLAKALGLSYAFHEKRLKDDLGASESCWFILSRNKELVAELIQKDHWKNVDFSAELWTDDYTNIFTTLLKFPR